MAITNYTTLVASIQDWLARNDLGTIADDLIMLAEQEMYDRLRLKEMQIRLQYQISTEFSDLPTDYLEAREFKLIGTSKFPMKYLTPESMDNIRQRGLGGVNVSYFTTRGTQFQLSGIPIAVASQTVSSLTSVGTTVTMTTALDHGIIPGDSITVSGAVETAYNGTFTVDTVPTTTTLTYIALTTPSGSPATGTITYVVNNVELTYYFKFPGITSTNTTNIILTNYPQAYLWGCLSQASTYIADPNRIDYYSTKFNDTMDKLNTRASVEQHSGSTMRATPDMGFFDGQ